MTDTQTAATHYHQFLLEQVDQCRDFSRLVDSELEPGDFARLRRLEGSARALVVSRLQQRLGRPVLVVAPDAEAAEAWYDDFEHFGIPGLLHFPMTETLPYEAEEPVVEIVARQYGALYYLRHGHHANVTTQPPDREDLDAPGAAARPVIVAPVEALARKIPAPDAFQPLTLTFCWGEFFEIEDVAARLVDMGYARQTMAEARGEFSVRGHIVDVFPPHFENPVRFDLFGDEIESIRFYDATTQRSIPDGPELERVTILPVCVQSVFDRLAVEARANGQAQGLVGFDQWLPEDTLVVLDAPEKFDPFLEQFDRVVLRRYEELREPGRAPERPEFTEVEAQPATYETPDGRREVLAPMDLFHTGAELRRELSRFTQIHIPRMELEPDDPTVYDFGVSSYETIPPDLEKYLALIRQKQSQDFSVHVVCDNEGQAQRLSELLGENEITSRILDIESDAARDFSPRSPLEGYQEIVLTTGPMHAGFIFPDARLLIVTDREMFGRYKRRHVYRKAYKGKAVSSVSEIRRGDFVVHTEHGVGRFLGIRKQEIDQRATELLEIEYAEGNKLLVPIENVRHVQKYTSTEGAVPSLDRLGGKRWQSRRRKSQEKIEQMAEELLHLYAHRSKARGHAFQTDTVWMQEFEEAFLHTETPDQLRAIEETKNDMMSDKPMDRLLCGDVGFGKTEVAMRGAFKAVQDKKQVAVLVPTTILAQQHYTTFRERFADYPVRIEVISRFRTDKEQHDVLRDVKMGAVDILIGTHRLLSQDVSFLDLGLLIVDEEHRFGVRQKEKIKHLRASIDILTLSATPIPRTLHMALSGLRDMSTINTPPRDRLPIRTRVIRFVPEEIEEAVQRELNRGGQIYFVHNRVQSIDAVARRLQEIVPSTRIAIAHGQMHERELEKVMLDFIDRKYDILLSTTIIESGLDIPNVNTIIINRADAFGLAQLYQLRGRVGRDVKRAYAYLIVPDGKPITDTAIKRLRAIEEFTELGTGFQIAMRDLEIRGTGNLLGSEQHGAIEAVGFELYCTLLEEAVRRLQGEPTPSDLSVEVKWSLPAYLPSEYVPVEPQRVAFYKRCSGARTPHDLDDLSAELRDRYGAIPEEARNLIAISLVRVLAQQADVEKLSATSRGLKLVGRGDTFDFLRRALPLKDSVDVVNSVSADSTGAVLLTIRDWKIETGARPAARILKALAEATGEDDNPESEASPN